MRGRAEKVNSLEKAVICHWSKYQGFFPPFSGTLAGHRCLRCEESDCNSASQMHNNKRQSQSWVMVLCRGHGLAGISFLGDYRLKSVTFCL